MKKFYFVLIIAIAMASGLQAQTFSVTFQVDMSAEANISDTISVAGNFQLAAGYPSDWTPGQTIMTDLNVDSVYDITVSLPAGTYQYKFINGTQWGQDESVPGACAVSGNREVVVTGNTTIPVVCFSQCGPCPATIDTLDVTFAVDMRNETFGDTVSVAGSFQSHIGHSNWTPGQSVLTDPDNDSIFTATWRIPEGSYEYKFINGDAWGQDESVPAACAVNNNRLVVVAGSGAQVIPTVCFATCDSACTPPSAPINVTFRVNMSNEIVASSGVYVSGNFQDPAWVKDTLMMTDPNADMVYEYTETIVPGTSYQYKYFNGDGGDPDGETADFQMLGCGVPNGIGGWDRLLDLTNRFSDTTLPVYYFNTCNIFVGMEDAAFEGLEIYPNPFGNSTNIRFGAGMSGPHDLQVFDLRGQVVRNESDIQGEEFRLERGDLPAGVYLLRVRDAEGSVVNRKIVLE